MKNFILFFTESTAHASYNSTIWQIDSILFLDPLQKYKFIESSLVGDFPEVSFGGNIPRTAQLPRTKGKNQNRAWVYSLYFPRGGGTAINTWAAVPTLVSFYSDTVKFGKFE